MPVVFRSAVLDDDPIRYRVEEDDFEIGRSRRDGEPTTWLYVGAGPGRSIDLTVESASFLFREAAEHLGGSDERDDR